MNITGNLDFRLVEGANNGYAIHMNPTGAFASSYTQTDDPDYGQLAKSGIKNAWLGIIGFDASKSWTGVVTNCNKFLIMLKYVAWK